MRIYFPAKRKKTDIFNRSSSQWASHITSSLTPNLIAKDFHRLGFIYTRKFEHLSCVASLHSKRFGRFFSSLMSPSLHIYRKRVRLVMRAGPSYSCLSYSDHNICATNTDVSRLITSNSSHIIHRGNVHGHNSGAYGFVRSYPMRIVFTTYSCKVFWS